MLGKQGSLLLSAALLGALPAWADRSGSTNYAAGDRSVFMDKFKAYQARQQKDGPDTVTIALGQLRGLSRSFTGSSGMLALNLRSGSFTADLGGLAPGGSYGLWLIDVPQGQPVSDLANARWIKLAQVRAAGAASHVTGRLDLKALRGSLSGFQIDRVVLSRGDQSPTEVLASGSMSVLQKLFFRGPTASTAGAVQRPLLPLASLVPEVLAGTATAGMAAAHVPAAATPLDVLIEQGARLFFDHTFEGNGRTCGTCHPADRNFTIDPEFINSLPPDDPLFVAETNPALAQLERPALMRQFGLILENLDGLDDPTNKFVMRSVSHTLGMQVSLTTDQARLNPPAAMTGWSGDGAPGAGSLRDFAVGAVTQHLTRSLNRVAGVDFVLPNDQQLDALEAFQLSLGRSTDFDLGKVRFLDADVASGQALFINGTGSPTAGGRCSACHVNGGALAGNGQNRNFNTNVEDMPHPARRVQAFPHDGGFGQALNGNGTFGDLSFNTPSVVEAADTAPFFHNNVVDTLEDVVRFYAGPEFNTPRSAGGRFSFTPAQVQDIANFMRGLNTLQNIDQVRRSLKGVLALPGDPQPQVQDGLQLAASNTEDAIRVLDEGGIFPRALPHLDQAQSLIAQAQAAGNPGTRSPLINRALAELDAAQALVATIAP
jgi:cytochrome c peroxidase